MEDKLYRSTGSEGSLTDIRWKNRNVSLDILRILCMFLIVLGHAMIHGQVLDAVAANSPNYFLLHVLRAFLSVHVNCFVLISGYFLCTHEFRIRKFFFIMGTGILLVAYTLSFPVYQWFCSVCVKIVAKGLLAFYAAALLVCYDLSFDVPISPNLERGCSFDEPKAACLFFSSIFYGIYRSPKSVLLGKIHFNKQL